MDNITILLEEITVKRVEITIKTDKAYEEIYDKYANTEYSDSIDKYIEYMKENNIMVINKDLEYEDVRTNVLDIN